MNQKAFSNPLPGVPSIESPFFSAIFADEDESVRQIALQMRTQGYAVIDFPQDDFAATAETIKSNLGAHFSEADRERFRQGEGGSLRVQDAWEFDAGVKQIACNPQILALLGKLYGRRACPFQTLNFPVGTEQHFHTDAIHFSSSPERFMCGVWVALEDITLENGPLQYYPGSHRWPVYSNEHIGRCATTMAQTPTQAMYEEMWCALVAVHDAKAQQFLAKKGQALIWAANLMHGGSPQRDKRLSRWSQVTHYFFEDCAYFTPMLSDPFFGQIDFRQLVNIETGQPLLQQYLGNTIPANFIAATAPGQRSWEDELDPALYLAANPDVREAGMNPFEHYMRYGRREKRRLRP